MREPLLGQLSAAPVRSVPGLWKHRGVWAMAYGVWNPVLLLDRMAEQRAGFEAMMFHESLHVQEHHLLAANTILGLGALGTAVAFVRQEPWGSLAFLLVTLVGWILWRREIELRSDAYSLRGVSTVCWVINGKAEVAETAASHEKGMREFLAFTLLHEHPTGWFWRFCYGRSPVHRLQRALARMRRTKWVAS